MAITIRPASKADLPTIGALSDYAFRDHAWTRAMYTVHDTPGNIQRYIGRHTKAMGEPNVSFFVAVDGDGDPSKLDAPVIGYSKWTVTTAQEPESVWNKPYEPWPVPEGASQEANDAAAAPLHYLRVKHYKGEPMVLLNFLVVSPDHQRKGVGSQLLEWGLRRADELGLPSWLESTENGYGLYAKHGFEPVEKLSVDFSKYGVNEPGVLIMMRRSPVSNQSTAP